MLLAASSLSPMLNTIIVKKKHRAQWLSSLYDVSAMHDRELFAVLVLYQLVLVKTIHFNDSLSQTFEAQYA